MLNSISVWHYNNNKFLTSTNILQTYINNNSILIDVILYNHAKSLLFYINFIKSFGLYFYGFIKFEIKWEKEQEITYHTYGFDKFLFEVTDNKNLSLINGINCLSNIINQIYSLKNVNIKMQILIHFPEGHLYKVNNINKDAYLAIKNIIKQSAEIDEQTISILEYENLEYNSIIENLEKEIAEVFTNTRYELKIKVTEKNYIILKIQLEAENILGIVLIQYQLFINSKLKNIEK